MTDSEAAGLLGIALKALMSLPAETQDRLALRRSINALQFEITRLRNQSPEDVQREFEK